MLVPCQSSKYLEETRSEYLLAISVDANFLGSLLLHHIGNASNWSQSIWLLHIGRLPVLSAASIRPVLVQALLTVSIRRPAARLHCPLSLIRRLGPRHHESYARRQAMEDPRH